MSGGTIISMVGDDLSKRLSVAKTDETEVTHRKIHPKTITSAGLAKASQSKQVIGSFYLQRRS